MRVAKPVRRLAPLLAAIAAAVLVAQPAAAASLGWMKGEAASFFTDRDWELLRSTLDQALEAAADGDAREWSNESSGARGRLTPLASETRGDVTCRRLRIESTAKGASSSHRYLFCRRAGGAWGLGQPQETPAK